MRPSRTGPGIAVVTDAASALGAAYAQRLARRGHDLLLVAGDGERVRPLAARIARESGRRVEVLLADLTAKKDLIALEQRLADDARIRVLVNNAALGTDAAPGAADAERLQMRAQLDAIVLARLSRAAGPAFVRRGGGTIVNIGHGVAAHQREPVAARKPYVLSLSQGLHQALGIEGLRVQAVLSERVRAGAPMPGVMSADDVVDAALAGLDGGELVTVPSHRRAAPAAPARRA